MSYWRKVGALIAKDLIVERRTRQALGTMLVFAVTVLVTLSFAFDLRVANASEVAPGALWVAIAFASVLGLNRSLSREQEDGAWEGLLLAPVERNAIYIAKAVGNLLTMAGVELVLLPLATALLGADLLQPAVILVVALGTFGLASLGTLLATVASETRARDALLPILLLPLSVPLLLAAAKATAGLLDGVGLGGVAHWLRLLLGFDMLFAAAAIVLFEHLVEE
jgi:heme exporter protein B